MLIEKGNVMRMRGEDGHTPTFQTLLVVDNSASSSEETSCSVIADSTLLDLMSMDSTSLDFDSLCLPLSISDTFSTLLGQEIPFIALLLCPTI